MNGLDRWATAIASTKRETFAAGKSAGAAVNLTGINCMPLTPVDAETRARPELQSFASVKETFMQGSLDIKEGDFLTIAGMDYPVRLVEDWPWIRPGHFMHIVVEEIHR